jgi:hypothetical protein
MKFLLVTLIFFFSSCCTCSAIDEKVFSLNAFLPLFEKLKQSSYSYIELDDPFVRYVREEYKTNPQECLAKAFEIENLSFTKLFFEIISYKNSSGFYLDLESDSYSLARYIQCGIKRTVRNILFEPFNSPEKLNENSLVIKHLSEFYKRYCDPSFFIKEFRNLAEGYLKSIETWEYTMSYLLVNSPNGEIDFNLLFSFVPWPNGTKGVVFPMDNDKKLCRDWLVFSSYLHQIIQTKDLKIFEINDPSLIFLLAFILANVNDKGKSMIKEFDCWQLYCKLKEFFELGSRPDNLFGAIKWKMTPIIRKAEAKVEEYYSHPYCVYFLAASFEIYFNENPNDENRSILFLLKSLSLLEGFVNTRNVTSFRYDEILL